MKFKSIFILFFIPFFFNSCTAATKSEKEQKDIKVGAQQFEKYLHIIQNKKIALVVNHTSMVGNAHLVDTLISLGIELNKIVRIFTPEHGFRGNFDAGEKIDNSIDKKTGIPLISLYGSHKKPFSEDLENIDYVIFDLQDVGVRFYTYISTLHYVMEACAEQNVSLILLDRPNPNDDYIDGPILDKKYSSFVGMHPIPIVYALTIGELALMINEEGWLKNKVKCKLQVISCKNYYHGKSYSLPVNPSPNLANDHAIKLYPSTCLFEGTVISEGRGTKMPFEIYGHPDLKGDFSFTPKSIPGVATYPKFENEKCYGQDLRNFQPENSWNQIYLHWLIKAYYDFPQKEDFFIPFFENLAGTEKLRKQIIEGKSEAEIRKSWEKELNDYKKMRKKYLIYSD